MTEKNGENFFCIYAVSHLHCNPYGGVKCLQQITPFQSIICILLLINIPLPPTSQYSPLKSLPGSAPGVVLLLCPCIACHAKHKMYTHWVMYVLYRQ